jgi:hypothetical protein
MTENSLTTPVDPIEARRKKDRERKRAKRAKEKAVRDFERLAADTRNAAQEKVLRLEEEAERRHEMQMARVFLAITELASKPEKDPEYVEHVVNEIETLLRQFDPWRFRDAFYEMYTLARQNAYTAGEAIPQVSLLPPASRWLEETRLKGRLDPIYRAYDKLRAFIDNHNAGKEDSW